MYNISFFTSADVINIFCPVLNNTSASVIYWLIDEISNACTPLKASICSLLNSLTLWITPEPPLTSSLTAYVFPSSSIPFEKNHHSPKQWFSLPKILPSFLCIYYKKLSSVPVFLNLWHPILCLVFQHYINTWFLKILPKWTGAKIVQVKGVVPKTRHHSMKRPSAGPLGLSVMA